MSKTHAMVVVGAGEAGTAAAIGLRQGGWQGPLVLIGDETILPYERPPLSKTTLIQDGDPGPAFLVTEEQLAEFGIRHVKGPRIESIDRASHTARLASGERLTYERLLLATGARPRTLSISTAGTCSIATLRTYGDALAIRQFLLPGRKVVIIGGGFIGLEVAASATMRGASVTVIEAGSRLLMRAVPAPLAELIKGKHENRGVSIETGALVERVETNQERSCVVLEDGRTYDADLVVVGIGATPNVELAEASGLAVQNGILVDETLATSDPDIFAAGDCCSFPHRLYSERIRLESWRNAQRQGVAAAANMLGANRPYEDVPWFWSDQYDDTLQIAGLCREGDLPVARAVSADCHLSFYLAADGRLVAACGFGDRAAIAKDIRVAEMMIGREIKPKPEALADPSVNLRSLLG